MSDLPFISVIIPVSREPRLKGCLCALLAQTYPTDRWEAIVVDIENRRDTVYDTWVRGVPNARLLRDPGGDATSARNAGARAARGEVLAFTDADCLPERDWLVKGARALGAGSGPLNGRVTIFHLVRRPTAAGIFDEWFLSARRSPVVDSCFFVYRVDFERVGDFSAVESDWYRRAVAAGLTPRSAPEVVVRRPAGARLMELLRKALVARELPAGSGLETAARARSLGVKFRLSFLIALVRTLRMVVRQRI